MLRRAAYLTLALTTLCASTLDGVTEGDRLGGGETSGLFENAKNGANGIIEQGPSGPTPVFSVPFATDATASDGTTPTFSRASTAYGTRVVGGQMELVEFGVNQPRIGSFIDSNGVTQNGVLIEGSSETLALHSSIDGSQPAWTLSNCTTPLSAVDGPDPTTKARS
ncbi:MAG: hypothetical protein AAF654_14800, partial [Myxococcota bacterium]